MQAEIIQPVAALAVWTMIMWVWLYATRIPAMGRAKIDAAQLVGTSGTKLREQLVAGGEHKASWVADNYNHLHEAPTLFYAVALALAMIGQGNGMNAMIAWAYVGLRVVHSLVQATVNKVMLRFAIFALSSIALMMLVAHLALAVF